jgi:hypothetical protein
MWEVVAAIVGVLLGALITWIASRKRPNHVEYREVGQYRFRLPAPAKIVVGGQTLEAMHLTRLALSNRSNQAIKQPQFKVEIAPEVRVLSFDVSVSPERVSPNDIPQVNAQQNTATVTLPILFPYALNREVLLIDLYSVEEIQQYSILGAGLTDDQYGWAVKEAKDWIRLPIVGFRIQNSRLGWVAAGIAFGFVVGWLLLIGYLLWQMATGLINGPYLLTMVTRPLFLGLLVFVLLMTGSGFLIALQGWWLNLPIPFTHRRLYVEIRTGDSR